MAADPPPQRAAVAAARTSQHAVVAAARLGALAGVALSVVLGRGSLVVAVVVLAAVGRSWRVLVAGAAAAVVCALRFGTVDLADLAGLQAVLGPAAGIEPLPGAAASVLVGVLVLVAVARPAPGARPTPGAGTNPMVTALVAGALAVAVAVGPSAATLDGAGIRFGATVVAVVVARGLIVRRLAVPSWALAGGAVAAVALAAFGDPVPIGGLGEWSSLLRDGSGPALALVVAGAGIVATAAAGAGVRSGRIRTGSMRTGSSRNGSWRAGSGGNGSPSGRGSGPRAIARSGRGGAVASRRVRLRAREGAGTPE